VALTRSDAASAFIFLFAIVWLSAPAVAAWMSRSWKIEDELLSSPEDKRDLRLVARRTWRYFETFVTAADNMLPPDNFQEDPKPVVAHRTSPTNIGLYLLSLACARQYGWMGLADAVSKLEATLASMQRLETHRGHLYNWYDTESLAALEPKYVSTVDSGNLAGHLIALANYCVTWRQQWLQPEPCFDGIADSVELIAQELADVSDDRRVLKPVLTTLERQLSGLRAAIAKAREEPEYISVRLIDLAVQAAAIHKTVASLSEMSGGGVNHEMSFWAGALRDTIESHFKDTALDQSDHLALLRRIEGVEARARSFAYGMQFEFLLDPQRNLLSIGYRLHEGIRDESSYDMLASEARLASFLAVAKGDLRTRHWFKLGRTLTQVHGGAALLSWSGSMFEYLMPSLVMRAPSGGLMDQTTRLIVERQISFAQARGIPWGISESAFNARDTAFTYQYSNFGVPGLGLKRGLAENTVIAPYATGLAAMVAPRRAAQNYRALTKRGARGVYGYYEAIDYTKSRVRKGEQAAIVKAYFAHHQGMTIAAILNAVKDGDVRTHFHAEASVRAAELLLQERASRNVPVTHVRATETESDAAPRENGPAASRVIEGRELGIPATQVLANGQMSVMMTATGSGYTAWSGLALTRWREDAVCDDFGQFYYLRDVGNNATWSAGHMPIAKQADNYRAQFSEDRVEITRKDGEFSTTLECVVSPEDNAEARRVTVQNDGRSSKVIEITSYVELVLAPASADAAHPAFSKLFVQTSYLPEFEALVATRRRRNPGDPEVWVAQFVLIDGETIGEAQYETDRARFVGRGNTTRSPVALKNHAKFSNTTGTVLDPVFSLRHRVRISTGRQARFTFWTVVAKSRDALLELVERHRQPTAYGRAQMLAWTQAQIQLRHLSIRAEEALLYQTLAGHLIYANASLRMSSKVILQDLGSQSALWPQGISGDLPILLVRVDEVDDLELVRQLLHGSEYWKSKHLAFDLVILNDRMSSYTQDLQVTLEAMVRKISQPGSTGKVYALRADLLSADTLRVLPAASRVVLYGRRGKLEDQLRRLASVAAAPVFAAPVLLQRRLEATTTVDTSQLEFFNGFGGFGADGKEYVMPLRADNPLPAPWINVVSNTKLGFLAGADAIGCTWAGNSRENQITHWSNDPVVNPPSEVFYVRCVSENFVVSPTLAPLHSSEGSHTARHGFGYTVYERHVRNLKIELLQCVPLEDPIKLTRLRITNTADKARELDVTFYAELVLGTSRTTATSFVTTSIDAETDALFAENRWRPTAGAQVAFLDMGGRQLAWTGDRRSFFGASGSLADPAALRPKAVLSNQTGGGFDPCCALQTKMTVAPGETVEVPLYMGMEGNAEAARALLKTYRSVVFDDVLKSVAEHWNNVLGAVKVKTPERSMDIMLNGWLLYQTLACRMLARAGFYQASGAYGFRDQLQDGMALLTSQPALTRQHILKAASRQFVEGDVQHWWLPETGMGVRTRISDDTVWLAFCVHHYVKVTGDIAILDEELDFIDGPALQAGEHDLFFMPQVADEKATLYSHCVRALERNLAMGEHGLPLMGTGDWNDGMNRVGEHGKGESVWLGWFLLHTLKCFSALAVQRGDVELANRWIAHADRLANSLNTQGWDGTWYRRGFYDDGTPLGSAESDECQIDSIAQSWAVLSGGAEPHKAAAALDEAYNRLINEKDGIALLFTPPFDQTPMDPGYIKAYPPGIRENGGQYTHGVIWSIFAFAELGEADRAEKMFSMLNPLNHARTEDQARTYCVEPYVVAADVYSVAPHKGRGGWTWYTGSAGWLYRAGVEAVLGVTREAQQLRVKTNLPTSWNGYQICLRFGNTTYDITVSREASQHPDHTNVQRVSKAEFLINMMDTGNTQTIMLPAVTTTNRAEAAE
jgi:cyclic beta-1,2-glucan synthetase